MFYKNLDLSVLNDDEVIFFIRIRGKKSYFKNVYTEKFLDIFKNVKNYRCISEYKKDADVHIDLNSIDRDFLYKSEFSEFEEIIDIEDVIVRCRALRETSFNQSSRMIFRAYLFFKQFFTNNPKLKVVVTGAVDNYVMDIMQRVGESHSILFIGVTDSFMSPTYKLITVRGEQSDFNNPKEEEVNDFFYKIKNTRLSPIAPKRKKAITSAAYDLMSYVYRYVVRYLIKHKLFNRLEYEYQFAPLLKKFNSLDQLLAVRKLLNKEDIVIDKGKKVAYLPLHFYPEATTDYWIDSRYDIMYLDSVLSAINCLTSNDFQVLVKEHPAYYLGRTASFYDKIKSSGAILLSPFVSTKEVFEIIDIVVVWNGSTGIEAVVNNKPLVKVTNSYYGDGIIKDIKLAKEMPIVSDDEGKEVVRKVLKSSFRAI